MAAIAIANVTFAITNNFPSGGSSGKPEVLREGITRPRKAVECLISFGDGALTYPVGGVPITGNTLPLGMGGGTEPVQACVGVGCPTVLEQLDFSATDGQTGANKGFVVTWAKATNKLQLWAAAGGVNTGLNELTAAATPIISLRVYAEGY